MTAAIYTAGDILAPFTTAIEQVADLLGLDVTVDTTLPDVDDATVPYGWPPSTPPHVLTALDGAPTLSGVAVDATYRLTVWAPTQTTALELADQLLAGFVAGHIPGLARRRRVIDPIPAVDDLTGAHLATASVAAITRYHPTTQEATHG